MLKRTERSDHFLYEIQNLELRLFKQPKDDLKPKDQVVVIASAGDTVKDELRELLTLKQQEIVNAYAEQGIEKHPAERHPVFYKYPKTGEELLRFMRKLSVGPAGKVLSKPTPTGLVDVHGKRIEPPRSGSLTTGTIFRLVFAINHYENELGIIAKPIPLRMILVKPQWHFPYGKAPKQEQKTELSIKL